MGLLLDLPMVLRIRVSSHYIEVRMDTSGPYSLVKARTDTSGICASTQHTGHTHTLHSTYTIEKHSLRALFTRTIYNTRTRFTSTLSAHTIYAPTYVYNQCQRSTCKIYAPNLCRQPTSQFGAHILYVLVWSAYLTRTTYASNLHDTSRDRSQFGAQILYVVVWRARIYYKNQYLIVN